jgi:hypothetical protein
MEERNEIKEYIKDCIMGVNARLDSRFEIIDLKLGIMSDNFDDKLNQVNIHLEKQNGRIGKSEKVLSDFLIEKAKELQKHEDDDKHRPLSCPHANRIQQLETENITKKEIKKYIISTIVITSVITGTIFSLIKIIDFF